MLSFSNRAEVPKHVLVNFLGEECVFLNLESEMYLGLDKMGTRMWRALTTAPNFAIAYEQLLSEFDVDPEILRQDFSNLLERLIDHGLLRIYTAEAESALKI